MDLDGLQAVAERKIQEAIDEGVFDDLPGKGKPLNLDDDPLTPAHLRLANKILKNANVLPDWMQLEKEIESAREEIARMWARLEAEYPLRHAECSNSTKRVAEFAAWHGRCRAAYLRAMKDVNNDLLKLSLLAPSITRPQIPYRVAEEAARFDERFPTPTGLQATEESAQDSLYEKSREESRVRSAAAEAYRIRSRETSEP